MDAAKFIEERKRMCKTFNSECNGCPALLEPYFCAVGIGSTMDPTAQIAIVEKWSKINLHKTRQSVFLEQWPEAKAADGVLELCPADVSSTHRNQYGNCGITNISCDDCCREFWMQEVE